MKLILAIIQPSKVEAVKEALNKINGQIEMKSTKGAGSTFSVRLPALA